jgi:hypothetical protein
VFHMDVAKVDREVTYVAKCSRWMLQVFRGMLQRLFKIFYLFQMYVASVFYLDVVCVSHICCKSMFKIFQLFQSYVAINVFILQVASVLSVCCICFMHILQVYVLNVLSALDVCCI